MVFFAFCTPLNLVLKFFSLLYNCSENGHINKERENAPTFSENLYFHVLELVAFSVRDSCISMSLAVTAYGKGLLCTYQLKAAFHAQHKRYIYVEQ
jgi:hypothetical protein